MSLEAFILGTGGMMPLPNRFLTSVLLRREGKFFLFDCGEGTQIALRNLNLKWKKLSVIFVSHTHADHITGIPGLLMLSSQVDRDEPLYIIGPPKIREYIETSIKVLDMYINYKIIIKEIENPYIENLVYEDEENNFCVHSFPLDHSKVCVGYKFVENSRPGIFSPEKAKNLNVKVGPKWANLQKGESVLSEDGKVVYPEQVLGEKRAGRKFSFITDTAYIETLSEQVNNSDLLICEGMFCHSEIEDAKEKKHLTATQAATIAKNSDGVKKMGLIHYSPRYTNIELRKMEEEAREIFPASFLTKDGQCIDIPNID